MLTSNPLVSVIIPCYNHGKMIQSAIDSVLHQTYTNFEIIIVDDGSTDPTTISTINTLEEKYLVIKQHNQGPSVARNNAIASSHGKYIMPLDSDNKLRPTYIEKAVERAETDGLIGVVYSNSQTFGKIVKQHVSGIFNIRTMLIYNPIDMCSLIRRTAFDSVNGLDKFMSKLGLEDWEFWIALYEKGWK